MVNGADSPSATVWPAASTMREAITTSAMAGESLRTLVCAVTLAEPSAASVEVTNVPQWATWTGGVFTSQAWR